MRVAANSYDFKKMAEAAKALSLKIQKYARDTGASFGEFACPICKRTVDWKIDEDGRTRGDCVREGCLSWME